MSRAEGIIYRDLHPTVANGAMARGDFLINSITHWPVMSFETYDLPLVKTVSA